MIWTLFYKACRILTFIIIAFLVILALTKFLPFIGSIFTKISNALSSFINGIEGFLTSLDK